jgi:hypothetical protein
MVKYLLLFIDTPFKSVFDSVVAGAFQIAFRAEIHANDVFSFFKIIFDISTSKRSEKYKPHSILAKKNFKI